MRRRHMGSGGTAEGGHGQREVLGRGWGRPPCGVYACVRVCLYVCNLVYECAVAWSC